MLDTATITKKDISLAIVKPKKVTDFMWLQSSKNWSAKQIYALSQIELFDKNKHAKTNISGDL